MKADAEDFIPTRASLISRLKNWDDQESWKDFFDTYWKMIYSVARRAGLSDAEAQDIVQETVVSVAKTMPKFKYDPSIGSFKGWLANVTRRRIMDRLRKRQFQMGGERFQREERLRTSLAEEQVDPRSADLDNVWESEWAIHAMETAMEKAKGQVSSIQYQIFLFHVVKNMPARQVAKQLDVKLPKVYFATYKVGRLIKKEIKKLERQMT
jgi:RNA polymerase sigma factor (sigma-70 family)